MSIALASLSGSIVFPKLLLAFPALLLLIHPDDVGASRRIGRRGAWMGRQIKLVGTRKDISKPLPDSAGRTCETNRRRPSLPPSLHSHQIRPLSLVTPPPTGQDETNCLQIGDRGESFADHLSRFSLSDVRDRDLLLHYVHRLL